LRNAVFHRIYVRMASISVLPSPHAGDHVLRGEMVPFHDVNGFGHFSTPFLRA